MPILRFRHKPQLTRDVSTAPVYVSGAARAIYDYEVGIGDEAATITEAEAYDYEHVETAPTVPLAALAANESALAAVDLGSRSGTIELDWSVSSWLHVTLTGAAAFTFTLPSTPKPGIYHLTIHRDSLLALTVGWPNGVLGTLLTLLGVNRALIRLTFDGDTWYFTRVY